MKISVPVNPGSGVYVTSPVIGSIVTVPFVGEVLIATVVGSMLFSGSVSFVNTEITTGTPAFVVGVSATATGGLSVETTFTVIVAMLDVFPKLSFTVYVVVVVPINPVVGTKVTTPVVDTVQVPSVVVTLVCVPGVVGSKSTVATSIVPSVSVSFNVTNTVPVVFTFVVNTSSFAVGLPNGNASVKLTVAV